MILQYHTVISTYTLQKTANIFFYPQSGKIMQISTSFEGLTSGLIWENIEFKIETARCIQFQMGTLPREVSIGVAVNYASGSRWTDSNAAGRF